MPHDGRLKLVMDAIRAGATPEEIFEATRIDPWFLDQLALINEVAAAVTAAPELTPDLLRLAKRHGFSDVQIGKIRGMTADVVRGVRHALGIRPVYKTVDTCAAEFAAATPYHYSSYDEETEVAPRDEAGRDHPGLRARTGSARASSSTTPACTPRWRSAGRGRRRLRDDHGQLQPRDRLHRLRHLRPPLLRAAHARGRARDRARRAAGRAGGRRDLPARRPDARSAWPRGWRTPASRSSARRPRRSTSPRSAAPSGGCSTRPA